MYRTNPGLFHEPPAAFLPLPQLPVGIVADTYEQALDYVLSAPMPSPYHVILEPEQLKGVRLGGLALLAKEPLSERMKAALTKACGLSG